MAILLTAISLVARGAIRYLHQALRNFGPHLRRGQRQGLTGNRKGIRPRREAVTGMHLGRTVSLE